MRTGASSQASILVARATAAASTGRHYVARVAFRRASLVRLRGEDDEDDDHLWIAWADSEHELGRAQGTGGYFEARSVLQAAAARAGARPSPHLLDSLGLLHIEHGMQREARACMRAHMTLWPRRPSAMQVHMVLERQRKVHDALKWADDNAAPGGGL
jgi:hypothetical protein